MPIKVLQLEMTEEIRPVRGLEGYDGLRLLVRQRGWPVGWVSFSSLSEPELPPARIAAAIADQLGDHLLPLLLGDGLEDDAENQDHLAPISVIVCTRDRPELLAGCLGALQALDYPCYEIVVVDNAPRTEETAHLAQRRPVRYVREERPGISWARNRGILAARHPLIAFTDDDARPDPGWLRALARALSQPGVMAATGLVVPTELETGPQIQFELFYGGMGHGFRRVTLHGGSLSGFELLWAGCWGITANAAFRRELFGAIGLFDTALGVGTPSGGGEDLELFHRLLARGHRMVYEPAALVWHTHRRDAASLRRLFYNNGRAFGSYLLTCARRGSVNRAVLIEFAVRQWGGALVHRLRHPRGLPRHLPMAELAGALTSPLAWRAAQCRTAALAISAPRQPSAGDAGGAG